MVDNDNRILRHVFALSRHGSVSSRCPAVARMSTYRRHTYENDDAAFPADTYVTADYRGVAVRVLGWETVADQDTDWSGCYERTGRVLYIMVGDDFVHRCDPDDLTPLDELAYCAECGQVGCTHDGRDRSEA